MSSIVNKIKEVVHDKKSSSSSSVPEGTHGPHHSRVANTADPRVDSDRDGSRNIGSNTGTHGYSQSDDYTHGGSNMRNKQLGDGPAPHTAGPHRSDALNKADPRIDSDRDGSRNMGMNKPHEYAGTGIAPEGTYGHHGTRTANAMDPRIDSDRDGSRNMGMNQPGEYTGVGSNTERAYGTHGIHEGGNTYGGGLESRGPAAHTAGPHKSDMMNKADPRIDSDLDGSKTYGGDKTYAQSNAHGEHGSGDRNPLDASQVPPSVLRKHLGNVEIAHNDHGHDRERRHSVATHQENHLMGNVA